MPHSKTTLVVFLELIDAGCVDVVTFLRLAHGVGSGLRRFQETAAGALQKADASVGRGCVLAQNQISSKVCVGPSTTRLFPAFFSR